MIWIWSWKPLKMEGVLLSLLSYKLKNIGLRWIQELHTVACSQTFLHNIKQYGSTSEVGIQETVVHAAQNIGFKSPASYRTLHQSILHQTRNLKILSDSWMLNFLKFCLPYSLLHWPQSQGQRPNKAVDGHHLWLTEWKPAVFTHSSNSIYFFSFHSRIIQQLA